MRKQICISCQGIIYQNMITPLTELSSLTKWKLVAVLPIRILNTV